MTEGRMRWVVLRSIIGRNVLHRTTLLIIELYLYRLNHEYNTLYFSLLHLCYALKALSTHYWSPFLAASCGRGWAGGTGTSWRSKSPSQSGWRCASFLTMNNIQRMTKWTTKHKIAFFIMQAFDLYISILYVLW